MKLPDINLFLYAYDSGSRKHAGAKAWLEQTLSGSETVGLAWAVLVSFVRLSTRRVATTEPFEVEQAIGFVEEWLAQPCATVVAPTHRHPAILRDLLGPLGTAGNLTSDAHLAALAIEHGATLCSCDNDFSRFPGLRWEDPLRA
ncbi:MAG TPA: type II toxin-antitoxin system VapC family toxin [Solirubrobacteraceae bacterium]|nr:type II toxin-antitoxin system VapC family toxin [Solirubrobacteraceae bacterium]